MMKSGTFSRNHGLLQKNLSFANFGLRWRFFKGAITYHWVALTDAERTEKNAKYVYPVKKVVSVAMKVVAEGVRSA